MSVLDTLNHLLNFFAPALVVGGLMALAAAFVYKKGPNAPGIPAQAAINAIAGSLALVIALWYFGRDGKMAGYAAMVVAIAASQAVFTRSRS